MTEHREGFQGIIDEQEKDLWEIFDTRSASQL